ncbi:hypothetical protein RAS12_30375 (plasmid) [Achromobacter seleniivolatilans]|uniref:TrfB transcriptional repressor protein domain-containing protein n=1 Tax=Achromobacter seleniivolatilans TaxID=3047478 RepID=A0ABY9MA92_9BURK|nr:hypothetical protein [Achromobacter sp. R39]WMD23941.1 hypothetical protein RAS12_30375 [Achromobacter sp. R39]
MTTEFSETLTTDQFAALADVARLDSPALRDAMRRIVLVGAQRLDVAVELGVGKATISNAISRLRGALSIAHAALPGRGGAAPMPLAENSQFDALCHIARLRPQEVVATRAMAVDGLSPEQAAHAADCSIATAKGAAGKLLAALDLAAAAAAAKRPPKYEWASRLVPYALPKQRLR